MQIPDFFGDGGRLPLQIPLPQELSRRFLCAKELEKQRTEKQRSREQRNREAEKQGSREQRNREAEKQGTEKTTESAAKSVFRIPGCAS